MDRETLQKLKALALVEMRHTAWQDTTRFQKGERSKLIKLIEGMYAAKSLEEIDAEFNTLVHEQILCNGAALDRIPVLR